MSFLSLVVLLFMIGVAGFFYIPKFRIKEISIEGTNVLDKNQLRGEVVNLLKGKFFRILPYDNIFLLPKAKIAGELRQKFPIVKKIELDRALFQKISVLIEERKPEALWCLISTSLGSGTTTDSGKESCAFVDASGFIFGPAPFFSGAIFLKFFDQRGQPAAVSKEMMAEPEFQKLRSFHELLAKNNINVGKIVLKDGEIYEVHLKEGWHILLNSKNEPNPSFNNLELILDTTVKEKRPKLEYIDLRFGNKVFYKLK